MEYEKSIDTYYGEYKKKGIFGKKYSIEFSIYPSRIEGVGFSYFQGELSTDASSFEIPYAKMKNAQLADLEKEPAILIEYDRGGSSIVSKETYTVALPGLKNAQRWYDLIIEMQRAYLEKIRIEEKNVLEARKKQRCFEIEREEKAKKFYQDCLAFHLKESRPAYQLYSEKNKAALIYVDETKSLNFLKIDGYAGEESNGLIAYGNIHYYEKAGNISYVTDIHGNYESFGGSVTGGSFSKLAAVGGGVLFGLMGMAAGAALTYKPAEQTPSSASFSIDSGVKRIDDRSVMLNFYSDAKKQYVDIELPQDIYNFLQTHLPEKKYGIVDELEKKAVLSQSAGRMENGGLLMAAADHRQVGMKEARGEPMEAFGQKVEKLKMMKEAGLLSEEEFAAEKKKLLSML